MTDPHLTKQDEDISAPEYAAEDGKDHYDFGSWPEVVGVALTVLLVWLTFAFNG
ncbi:hypothetical protein [Sulfitobacter sp.]|uniref:hypothetical protein n=1 Tax=Sulfitobacter sp. TaxID=1903071 RepID=UPI003566DC71